MNESTMPGRKGYGLAAGMLVLSMVAFAVFVSMLGSSTDQLTQVIAPGETDLSLDEAGDYTIFYESESIVDDQIVSTGEMPPMNIGVFSKETGQPVDVSQSSVETTYSIGGRSGESIAKFTVETPGDYTLKAEYPGGEDLGSIVLAVGSGVAGTIFGAVASGLAGGGLLVGACIAALVTFFRRRQAKRRQSAASAAIQQTA